MIAVLTAIVLSAMAIIFCSLWLGSILQAKELNRAKFEVLNAMAPRIRFGNDAKDERVSFEPFQKEWMILEQHKQLVKVTDTNIIALKPSNIEYLLPQAFRALFAGIIGLSLIVFVLNWNLIVSAPVLSLPATPTASATFNANSGDDANAMTSMRVSRDFVVIMPISSDEMATTKVELISSVALAHGFVAHFPDYDSRSYRFDLTETKQRYRACAFIIADLSYERPSCYYELGIAEALGKTVHVIAVEGTVIHQTANRDSVQYYRDVAQLESIMVSLFRSHLNDRAKNIGAVGLTSAST